MNEFGALSSKICSYLTDNNDEDKKAKVAKKCIIKRKLKFDELSELENNPTRKKRNLA